MLSAFISLCLLLPLGAAVAESASSAGTLRTKVLGRGAWCWFADPRALSTDTRTVTGWVAEDGSIMAATYDNATGTSETVNLHPQLQYDDHANPAFYRRQDGRITAFYSGHNGAELYYRTLGEPDQFGSWGPEQTVGTNTEGESGYTYPNPVWSPLERKLYLFWRGGNFLPTYSTSSDEGETWAPARTLLDDGEPNASMRPYAKYTERNGVIHMAYTQAHPRDRATHIYYLKYTPGVGWQRAGGDLAGGHGVPPFVPSDGDMVYNAYDYSMRSWVHDIAVGPDGHPRIVFATFSRSANYTDHRYWYARWDGTKWLKWQLTWAGPSISPGTVENMYSAGITLDQEHPHIVYLSRKCKTGCRRFQVEVWRTTNGGTRWAVTPVARGIRPVSPRRHTGRSTLQVLYMVGAYGTYMTYQTEVRLSDVEAATATSESSLRTR